MTVYTQRAHWVRIGPDPVTLVLRLFEAVRYTRKPHDAGRFRPSETGGDTPSTPTLKNNRDYKHSATFVFMGYPHVQYCTKPALGFSSHFLALSMIVNVDGPPLSGTPSFVTGANAERSLAIIRMSIGHNDTLNNFSDFIRAKRAHSIDLTAGAAGVCQSALVHLCLSEFDSRCLRASLKIGAFECASLSGV